MTDGTCGHFPPGVAKACQMLGKPWTTQLLWVLLQEPMHFNGLLRAIPGISREMLRLRLVELRDAGLVERCESHTPKVTYHLTPEGEGLRAALAGIGAWASRREDDGNAELAV